MSTTTEPKVGETHEQRVERLARAAYETSNNEWDPAWWRIHEGMREPFRKLVRRLIASDRAAGYVTVPVDLLKDCADDLGAWVRFAYPEDSRKYPSEARRYVRDMEPAVRLRAAIAAHEQEGER